MHQENTMPSRRISVSLFIDQSIIWPVKRLQAFKFQLRPGGQQEREMRRFASACRFVFNRALALQNENHEAGNKYISTPSKNQIYFRYFIQTVELYLF